MSRGFTIKKRVFLTVAGILLASALATALLSYEFIWFDLRKDHLSELTVTESRQFSAILKADAEGLARAQAGLVRIDRLLELFARKDRDALLTAVRPIFDELRQNDSITHMYFIEPDGTVFLRVHKPGEWGDRLTRTTFRQSAATAAPASGLELGQNFFSLRSVRPLLRDGKVIGYLEVAEEIDHVFGQMKHLTGNDVSLFLSGEFLQHQSTSVQGERVGGLCLTYTTARDRCMQLAVQLGTGLARSLATPKVWVLEQDEKKFAVATEPVRDASGRTVGVLFSHSDITSHFTEMWKNIFVITGAFTAILLFALLCFGSTLKKTLRLFQALRLRIEEVTTSWDLSQRVEVVTDDEIGTLARSFNLMLSVLERQKDDLKNQVEFQQILMETVPTPIYYQDGNGRYLGVNSAFASLVGLTKEEILGKSGSEVGLKPLSVTCDSADPTRRTEINTASLVTAEGRHYQVIIYQAPFFNAQGGGRGLIGGMVDITQLKSTEETLRKSEYRFKALFDSQPAGVFILDAQSRTIVDVNPTALRMIDLPRERIVGQASAHFFKDQAPVAPAVAGAPLRPESTEGELLDGKGRPISIIRTAVLLTLDDHDFIIENFIDVSARRVAEQALRDSEITLKTLVDSMPVGVWWFDNNGKIEYLNAYFQERFGYTPEDIPNVDDWFRNAYPDPAYGDSYRAEHYHALEQARRHGTLVPPKEAKLCCKDGSLRHVIVNLQVEKNRTLVILTDITEHEFINSQLLKIQKLESLGVLAGGIAHDFNNILTSIMGNISFCQMLVDESHQARMPLEMAEKASHRAGDLARQLLTFAKGGEPIKKVIEVRHLVEESASLMLRGTKVRGDLQLPEALHSVEADESQLSQAFNNLVLNAVQAMPEGGTLTVSAENLEVSEGSSTGLASGCYVRISFADQGCGISKEDQKRIFDPYFTTKASGTGLGLASVHSIIVRHGGQIQVSSQNGSGTTFTILLPACRETPPAKRPGESAAAAAVSSGAYVLIMDDEEMIIKLASGMLTHLGYRVTTCVRGEDAVSLYRSARESGEPFDVAIMDLTVPGGMGGKEAAEKILDIDPAARLIVSSGYSNDPVMAQYTSYGFIGAVLKPYRVRDLAGAITQVLESPET